MARGHLCVLEMMNVLPTSVKKGPWTPEEDELLSSYIARKGEGQWQALPKKAGLLHCGKSCRLRWMNYLRPSVKRGHISADEEDLIIRLHCLLGNRWSLLAGRIPGPTYNEIKNYWNTHLSKKLTSQGIDSKTHKPLSSPPSLNPNHNLNHSFLHWIKPKQFQQIPMKTSQTSTPATRTVVLDLMIFLVTRLMMVSLCSWVH